MYNFDGMASFKPFADIDTNKTQAYLWLDRAIKYEAEKRPAGIIEKALAKACMYELAMFSIPPFAYVALAAAA